ncbi:hypothetical protein V1511DRAFT_508445 [Dipodascopsis uninucleata]
MSGGARYPFPKHVKSFSGGWWPNPVNWKKNTYTVVAGALFGIIFLKVAGPTVMKEDLPIEMKNTLALRFNEVAKESRKD